MKNDIRTYVCPHRHHVNSCSCAGDGCSHLSCWSKSRYEGGRVGYLDIEVDNLDADFGIVMAWSLKERDNPKIISAVITKKDVEESIKRHEIVTDKRILTELSKLLPKFDFVVCHYGVIQRGLDIRFLRTRFVKYGLKFPVFRQLFGLDTYLLARYKLKLHSNRLDVIAEFLGCKVTKSQLETETWQLAKIGDEKALAYVLDHNIRDTEILEFVHKKLEDYGNIGRTSV